MDGGGAAWVLGYPDTLGTDRGYQAEFWRPVLRLQQVQDGAWTKSVEDEDMEQNLERIRLRCNGEIRPDLCLEVLLHKRGFVCANF